MATEERLSASATLVFGIYLVVLALALSGAVIFQMQRMPRQASELDLVVLVLLAGALGSYVHAATSFTSYVGNQRLHKSWLWWYILRPFIGSALALIFYFVVRAGFVQNGSGPENLNLFGIAGLAGLTGMFSKQATDKLREVFDNLFSVKGGDDARADKLPKSDDDAPGPSPTPASTTPATQPGIEIPGYQPSPLRGE
ncbi:MAG: hypothetical protein HC897_10775 [Thermoanaerobaculia bacterium]|nr:hypothetical protein [Thermoanaerobaculia bacterium]